MIPIERVYNEFANSIAEEAYKQGVHRQVANAFGNAYRNIFAEFALKGEYYIYNGETYDEEYNVLINAHKGVTRSLTFILQKISTSGDYTLLSSPVDRYTVEGNSNNTGMNETSPINASTNFEDGGIVTPNSKAINKNNYDASHTRDNYDIRVRAFYEQIIRDNNLYSLVRKHFIQFVYDHNVIW